MTFGRLQVQPGMDVLGSGAQPIGRVSEVYDEGFRVVRPDREDISVPYEAIKAMIGEQVVLSVQANDVDAQEWSSSRAGGPPAE